MITGKEAKLAWANDRDIQLRVKGHNTWDSDLYQYSCGVFDNNDFEFRLKPRTITLNGIDIEIPKELRVDPITGTVGLVYGDNEKAKQVVEALREVFK